MLMSNEITLPLLLSLRISRDDLRLEQRREDSYRLMRERTRDRDDNELAIQAGESLLRYVINEALGIMCLCVCVCVDHFACTKTGLTQ